MFFVEISEFNRDGFARGCINTNTVLGIRKIMDKVINLLIRGELGNGIEFKNNKLYIYPQKIIDISFNIDNISQDGQMIKIEFTPNV